MPTHTPIIAEIGINANGSVELAKNLIAVAKEAGCDYVKFQKRTIDVVYSKEELEKPRESVFGVTNGHLKYGLEFGLLEYKEIDSYCKQLEIPWFASCWDEASVDFIEQFNPPFYKVASASLTDNGLLKHIKSKGRKVILSTGMSTISQINIALACLDMSKTTLMHTCAAYPSNYEDLNLNVIKTLKAYFGLPVGYSGHETGLASTLAAVALGACMIERHITLDRSMPGSDQAASLEPTGLTKLVRDIRIIERSMGSTDKTVLDCEIPVMKKLRRK